MIRQDLGRANRRRIDGLYLLTVRKLSNILSDLSLDCLFGLMNVTRRDHPQVTFVVCLLDSARATRL